LGGFQLDFAIFAMLISHSKHGRFLPSHIPVHPKGNSMSQATIDRRARLPFAAAGFNSPLRACVEARLANPSIRVEIAVIAAIL
jgi:hypothetical protein